MNEALFVAPTLAIALSAVAIWRLRRAARLLPSDIPNARSLHRSPVPRAGGYAIWLGFLSAAMLYAPQFPGGWLGWLPAWIALAVVSAVDDIRAVAVVPRLAVHASAALWAAGWLTTRWPGAPDGAAMIVLILAVALVIAWSSNLYNFMDGTDGLAASMGAVGFAAYGFAALAPDLVTTGIPSPMARSSPAFFALAGAILPFIVVNRPRATMFLGDVGAVPLGFLAAAFGVAGVAGQAWPAWFPVLVFLPFIADASLTLARRALRGERLWEGHRSHFYQRLHQLGAGHRGTLATYVAVMAGTAVTALACRLRAPAAGWWALAAWFLVVLMLFATIDYHWRKKTNMPAPR